MITPANACRRRLLKALAALPASVVSVGTPAFSTAAANSLVLGHSCALDGPMASINLEAMAGAAWHFEQVNRAGGIAGRPVRIVTLDDGYDATRTAANARALAADHGALAFFNIAGTPTSMAAIPVANELRVPMVAPFTGSGLLRRRFDRYVFNVRAGFGEELDKIVEHLTTIGIRDASVVYLNNPFGTDGLDSVSQSAQARGLLLNARVPVNTDGSTVRAAAARIAKNTPSAVIMVLAGALPSEFVRAYRAETRASQFYALSVVSPAQLLQTLGDQAIGIVISQVMPPATSGATALGRELLGLARAAGVKDPTPNHMEGYVSAKVVTEGLRRAGSRATAGSLVAGLESMSDHDLGGMRVRFSDRNHNGSTYVDLSVVGVSRQLVR